MILEKLRDLAQREGLLTSEDYEPKPVAWIIAIDDVGKLVEMIPTAGPEEAGRKTRGKVFQIPRRIGRTSSPVADFLVDKSEYVLGVEPDRKRKPDDLRARLELFRKEVGEAFKATETPALAAVDHFLANDPERGLAIEKLSAAGYASNDLFAFQYRGKFVHELADVKAYFSRKRRSASGDGVQCLVCGTIAAPVEKHPAVKIPGGSTSGVALVSFNAEAFESFGLSRNENAPVCRNCADAYTTALNRLLSDRYPDPAHPGETLPPRYVRLSPDTTAIFWAEQEATVLDLLTSYFDAPRAESVGDLLRSPRKGGVPAALSNRFYCLVLSGGQGRAIVRGMHTGTVEEVEGNIRAYFESIEIGSEQPMPLRRLMEGLVLQGKLQNLAPGLATDVFWAILFGRKFPRTLLALAVGRCRAERKVTSARAAILRAYMIRNLNGEIDVALDIENSKAGYRLGRLMAVLERIQGAAQNNPNKTIVDRYYGAASTRPATVFPRLLALTQHHLSKLAGGAEAFYQKKLGEVIDGIAPPIPSTLSLEDQGLFALGYYHQRQEFFRKTVSEPAVEDQPGDEKGERA
jgi:CRISPR-associated protein Csd1